MQSQHRQFGIVCVTLDSDADGHTEDKSWQPCFLPTNPDSINDNDGLRVYTVGEMKDLVITVSLKETDMAEDQL